MPRAGPGPLAAVPFFVWRPQIEQPQRQVPSTLRKLKALAWGLPTSEGGEGQVYTGHWRPGHRGCVACRAGGRGPEHLTDAQHCSPDTQHGGRVV